MIAAWIHSHLLSFIIFAPLLLSFAIILLPKHYCYAGKLVGFIGTLIIMLMAFTHLIHAPTDIFGQHYTEYYPLLTAFDTPVDYHVVLDGLNLWLVLLTTLLVPITILNAWHSLNQKPITAIALLLMLETSIIGALVAQDLMIFYIFWSAAQLLIFLLIGIWGNKHRQDTAFKFITITICGSLPYLVSILFLAEKAGSFNLDLIAQTLLFLPPANQVYVILAFIIFLLLNTPLFPFCDWLPTIQANAHISSVIIITGAFTKLGPYRLLKFTLPAFPKTMIQYTQTLAIISIITIIYGTIMIVRQTNIKKIIGYYSVNQMALATLGITSATFNGIYGATTLMLNCSIATSALIIWVDMLCCRNKTCQVTNFNNIDPDRPILTIFSILLIISSVVMPLISIFTNNYIIISGVYQSHIYLAHYIIYMAVLGIVCNGLYLLWLTRHIFYPKLTRHHANNGNQALQKDINLREVIVLASLIILTGWISIYPKYFLKAMPIVTYSTYNKL